MKTTHTDEQIQSAIDVAFNESAFGNTLHSKEWGTEAPDRLHLLKSALDKLPDPPQLQPLESWTLEERNAILQLATRQDMSPMKIYPYSEDGQIIELVRKDEHDAVVAELQRELDASNASSESELLQMVQSDNLQLIQQNERLIGERNELRQALTGRTVSCSNCNVMAEETAAMREAIKEAHNSISMCVHFMLQLPSYDHLVGIECEAFDLSQKALSRLQPFLK